MRHGVDPPILSNQGGNPGTDMMDANAIAPGKALGFEEKRGLRCWRRDDATFVSVLLTWDGGRLQRPHP